MAGSLETIGGSYRPERAPSVEQAAELYAEIALLHEPYVDVLLCEAMASVEQAPWSRDGRACRQQTGVAGCDG